jgi:uncharacterized membrane protein
MRDIGERPSDPPAPGDGPAAAPETTPPVSRRRGYLDWMRGLAVLIMIEAHLFDSWTEAAARSSDAFLRAIVLGGFGAPLFLLLAGVSVALSAGSKARRSADPQAASRAVARRGLEIFILAFLFRVQAWLLGLGSPWGLLRVDILNVMGPAIMTAAWLWGLVRAPGPRCLLFAAAAAMMSLLTPIVRAAPALAAIPDPLEAYLRPVPDFTNFMFFPWAGFVFAGGALGVLVDRARTVPAEARLNAGFLLAGSAVAAAAYVMSFQPSPYARSDFWTSSPSFFLLRMGLMTAGLGAAYAWSRRPWTRRWSPLEQLGRTSLFIYWIHVELVYGLISLKLHRALGLGEAATAFVLFAALMLVCSVAKDRVVASWRRRRAPAATLRTSEP